MSKRRLNFNGVFSIFVTLLTWEFIVRYKFVSEYLISMPSKILVEGFKMLSNGFLLKHILISLEAYLSGLLIALVLGITFGIILGNSKTLFSLFKPHIFILSSLPMVAIIPLAMIWLGIGSSFKIMIVTLMSLIPILLNTIDGVKNVNVKLIKMAQSFQGQRFFIFHSIIFFNALPFIFSGLKIAAGRAAIGLVVSEAMGYRNGLGYLIAFFGGTYQTANLLFSIFVLLLLSLLTVSIVSFFEKKVIHWKNFN